MGFAGHGMDKRGRELACRCGQPLDASDLVSQSVSHHAGHAAGHGCWGAPVRACTGRHPLVCGCLIISNVALNADRPFMHHLPTAPATEAPSEFPLQPGPPSSTALAVFMQGCRSHAAPQTNTLQSSHHLNPQPSPPVARVGRCVR